MSPAIPMKIMVCEICGKEFKNAGGLRLHKLHKHPPEIPVEVPVEIPVEVKLNYRIFLYEKDKLIINYPVNGLEAVEEAKRNAEKRGYKIVVE